MYLTAFKINYYELEILNLQPKLLYNIGYIDFMTCSLSNEVRYQGKLSGQRVLQTRKKIVCVCVRVNFRRMTGAFTEMCIVCERLGSIPDFLNDTSNLSRWPHGLRHGSATAG
jgi:hypothetical protein